MGTPVIGGLENAGNEGGTDLEASYNSGLVAAAAGPSYPIAGTSPANRFSESQPLASTLLPLPPAKRPRGRVVPVTPTAAAAPQPAEGSSLVTVLERMNQEKGKQIEKLETKIEKLEERLEKLEERLEKLDDRNRKSEIRSGVFGLRLITRKDVNGRATGERGGKRKRGSSMDFASMAQLEEGSDDGDGGETI
jgi:TolA-binding protein